MKPEEIVSSKVSSAKLEVVAVCFARVKAFAGKGSVTAIVKGSSGECRLYGVSNLCKAGLLPDKYFGRYIRAAELGLLLGSKPVIVGALAVRKYLADKSIKGISADDVLEDAIERSSGRSTSADLKTF